MWGAHTSSRARRNMNRKTFLISLAGALLVPIAGRKFIPPPGPGFDLMEVVYRGLEADVKIAGRIVSTHKLTIPLRDSWFLWIKDIKPSDITRVEVIPAGSDQSSAAYAKAMSDPFYPRYAGFSRSLCVGAIENAEPDSARELPPYGHRYF